MESLWGEAFDLPQTKAKTKAILQKVSKPAKEIKVSVEKQIKRKSITLDEKLALIKEQVYKKLGRFADNIVVIKSIDQLHDYISAALVNKDIAIDTETNNSLDPVTCKLMGPCIYTPGQKWAYIPINHVNKDTRERLAWQLTEGDIKREFDRLLGNCFCISHNGKFDYEVLKCTTNFIMPIDWDTLIGAKCLDENERSYKLKDQYREKIDPTVDKYSIDELFEDIEYAIVEPEVFALYAATDSYLTYTLCEYQRKEFMKPINDGVYHLFKNLEMPLVQVIAEMELAGMEVDQEYGRLLSAKYHNNLDKIDQQIHAELEALKPQIDEWRKTAEANERPKKKTGDGEGKSKSEQLEEEINLASPTQLAILFYDVLKCPQVSKKSPRGTGENELKAIAEKLHLKLCDLILDRREQVKLLTTYIDVIPELAKRWPDGRVHTHFNQYGAATGRLSSSEPLNFQNIPAKNKEIRMLFKARDNYRIIGSDYSAQEPRLTAHYSGDKSMIKAYEEGKDLYAVIASMSFDRKYEDCLEFYPEGTEIIYEGEKIITGHKTHTNKEGKQYRSMAKSILLGEPKGYIVFN